MTIYYVNCRLCKHEMEIHRRPRGENVATGEVNDAIRACEAILARAFGRPEQKQEREVKGGLSFTVIVAKPEKKLEAGDDRRSLPREVNGDGQSLPGFRELPEGELPE